LRIQFGRDSTTARAFGEALKGHVHNGRLRRYDRTATAAERGVTEKISLDVNGRPARIRCEEGMRDPNGQADWMRSLGILSR